MTIKSAVILGALFFAGCMGAHASSAPFGALSAYNLVALSGNIVGTTADVEGRVAAAGQLTQALSIGATLNGDPWGSLANGYALVAAGGINVTSGNFVIGGTASTGGGWAASNVHNTNVYFNDGDGPLKLGGTSPIDFVAEQKAMTTLNNNLSTLTANGTVGCATGGNPSFVGLCGSSSTLNVFNLTAAQFDSTNGNQLDFITTAADQNATIIVNVTGSALVLNAPILINGQQEGDTNDDNNLIIFNFENASSVTINAQFDAALLAPNAILSGSSQMGGNFIAASVGLTGEVHNEEFVGILPSFLPAVPEPGSFTLTATGVFFLAGILLMRRRDTEAVPARV